MSTKSTSRPHTADDAQGQTRMMTELAGQQWALALEGMSFMYRAAEAVLQIQKHSTQRSALLHQQMAEKLRSINSPADFAAVQHSLLMSSMYEVAQYLQALGSSALRLQHDTMARTAAQEENAASAVFNNPILQAWQTVFTAPLDGAGAHQTH